MANGTATVEEFIAQLELLIGWRYNQAPCRLNDDKDCGTDCSGSQFDAYSNAVGVNPGGTVSSSMARWCYEAGKEITVEEGKEERGSWLFWGGDRGLSGFGNDGHIVTSLGDGTCIGTPGYNGVFGVTPWSYFGDNQPSGAALIPGITGYTLGHPDSPPPSGQPIPSFLEADMHVIAIVDQPGNPIFWFSMDSRQAGYVGESGNVGYIIKVLEEAGEKVRHVDGEKVDLDFKHGFTIIRDYIHPPTPTPPTP